jgi:hypothetical protein
MKTQLNLPQKNINFKLKRNLDNTYFKKHFGKNQSANIWDKDIFTGE